jgi:predicted DNA-binding ribbon-helix-helix protein
MLDPIFTPPTANTEAFWNGVKEIAIERDIALSDLLGKIDSERQSGNLSSSIRLFVLDFYRGQISEYEERARTRGMPRNAAVPTESKQTRGIGR